MTDGTRVYVGIGSNLGDRVATIEAARPSLRALASDGELVLSPLYESAPMGLPDQPDYVNAACSFVTSLAPEALLAALQRIEREAGRVRSARRWGARTLDLDLLLYGERVLSTPVLELPHPGIAVRDFVLRPLLDLDADLQVPGRGAAQALLGVLDPSALRVLSVGATDPRAATVDPVVHPAIDPAETGTAAVPGGDPGGSVAPAGHMMDTDVDPRAGTAAMTERQHLRIALLEDSEEQSVRVRGWIEAKGYHCSAFATAESFQRAYKTTSYDIVMLDWTLESGSSGLEILHWIRRTLTSDVPIIFVTSRQAEEDIVRALRAGADDYLAKPVRQHELLARLYALARRAQPEMEILQCPPYTFDTSTREVRMHDEPVRLTEKEYELALFLFRNRGRVLSRQHLLASVWGTSADLNTRTVDTHASRLRKKLRLLASERWKLTSIYQHGYRLEEHSSR